MDKVKILDKTFRIMISHEEIMQITDKVADTLNREYSSLDEAPVLLCTLNGALPFTSEIMQRLQFDPMVCSIKVSSYSGTESAGVITKVMGPTMSLEGKHVIVMEDIVDTGITLRGLRKMLQEMGVKSAKVCTMLYKPEKFHAQELKDGPMIAPEYVGKEIPNAFIVGFGLDYDEYGRCLRDIYVLDE